MLRKSYALLTCLISLTALIGVYSAVRASTDVLPRTANGTVTSGWTAAGTADGSCTGHCQYVDEVASGNGDGNTSYLTINNQTAVTEFEMADPGQGQTATSIRIYFYSQCRTAAFLGNSSNIIMTPIIQGVALTATTQNMTTCGTNAWVLYNFTYNGTWTQSDIDSLRIRFAKGSNNGAGQATIGLSAVYVDVTMREPDHSQSAVRVYGNADSTTPGVALAASNTMADVQRGAEFRIRTGISVSDYNWITGSWGVSSPNTYKLQFAQRSAASCAAQASGWGDVQSGSGNIRWYDNPGVADNAAIGSYADDPPVTGSAVYQVYRESNPFTNTSQVTIGNTGLWDFSLKDFSPGYGTVYCFRVVKSDGTLLNSYTDFPSIVTVGSLDIDIVDAGGIPVGSPNVPFSSVLVQPECQQSTATLGTSSQVVRVTNNIATGGWSVAMAATDGPTTYWTNGTNGEYDYNDGGGSPPGCTDSGDTDSRAGRLAVNPGTGSVTPQGGCSAAGLSLGSATSFTEGSIDSITLFSASSASPRFCYYSATDITMTQQIPTYRPKGSYGLDFTVTILAL